MLEVEIGIRHYGCPVSDTSADYPDIQIQNISKVEGGDVSKRLLGLRGMNSDISSFATQFRARDRVEQFNEIGKANDLTYFSAHIHYHDTPSIASLVESHGCYQHSTVTVQGGIENWLLYTPEREVVHNLVSEIESQGNDVALYQSVNIGELSGSKMRGFAGLLNRLTTAQKDAFEHALRNSYYDTDADKSIKDIAETMDQHHTTVWEHLTKAESKILRDVGTKLFNLNEPNSISEEE